MMKFLRIYVGRHAQNCVAALGNMSRQPLATLLTVTVIGVALAMPSALNVLVQNGQAIAGGWGDVRDFSVYLRPETTRDAAASLQAALQAMTGIADVRLITADEALEEFRDTPGFREILIALDDNPLPHTLVVRPMAATPAAELEALARRLGERDEVDLVRLDAEWVARLNASLDLLRRVIWMAAIMLVGAVIIIIGNTIRLDIQNRRAEIEVSKLLGATDGFVRRPFLYTGFWYGLLGGCFALLLLGLGLWLLSGPVARLVTLYGGGFRPLGLDGRTILAVLAGGLIAGLGGAWMAVARHLAAIQPKV